MTEAEWATCNNPKAMLGFLADRQQASERKSRLFSCACFRRVWRALSDQQAREAVEVAERYADGRARDDEREEALVRAANLQSFGGGAARWLLVSAARTGAMMTVDVAGQTAACLPGSKYDPARWEAEWQGQCDLLRDIFGPLPFRAVAIDPTWLSWNDSIVRRLAAAIYEERQLPSRHLDTARLAVLADALEESGCTDAELLAHLRSPASHVRGCFALDAILGKS